MRKIGCPVCLSEREVSMGQPATQSLYNRLNASQKKDLDAIRDRIFSSGLELIKTRPGDRVMEILESWLMETSARQSAPENIQRNIIQKAASFLDSRPTYQAVNGGDFLVPLLRYLSKLNSSNGRSSVIIRPR